MSQIYTAIFVDKLSQNVIYRMNQKNPLGKFFWIKDKLSKVEELSKKLEIPKSQIDVRDYSIWGENESEEQ